MPGGGDLDGGLRVAGMVGKGKWKCMPVGSVGCERQQCDGISVGIEDAQGQLRSGVFSLDPKRAFVFGIGLKKDAALPDTCISSINTQTDAFLAILKVEFGNFDLAMLRDRFPIGLEVRAFETCATDLFGEETIFDRVIDVFQELAVDAFVDGYGRSVHIHHEYGNVGFFPCSTRKKRIGSNGRGDSGSSRMDEELASVH